MRLIRWFAALPIGLVATHSIMLGVLLSALEFEGWISWGHEGLLVAMAPIVVWVLLQSRG